jgi:hypothetical protein
MKDTDKRFTGDTKFFSIAICNGIS